jgi:hypothetical protein
MIVVDYAKLQGKAKEDPVMIKTRERRLQMFLNRIMQHPILSMEHLFHRFLEPGNWSDVLCSQNISSKKGPESTSPKLTALVGQKKLRNPDLKFLEHEQYAQSLFNALSYVEKDHKKICKQMATVTELYSELGSVFNAFSLHETANPIVTRGIEEVGQAYDGTFLATKAFLSEMDEKLADHLHEYAQFAEELKVRLRAEVLFSKRLVVEIASSAP